MREVTHNIEEAVLMCDRILVLASNPGHIAAEIRVPLLQPRNRLDAAFHDIVDEIYSILTIRNTANGNKRLAGKEARNWATG
jgi:NitT/TauT family transport system ATP-binding protein